MITQKNALVKAKTEIRNILKQSTINNRKFNLIIVLQWTIIDKKGDELMAKFCCEQCAYYDYDEEYDEYFCSVNLDEDEMEKYMSGNTDSCHYFTLYDEYKVVRKQN